MFVEKGLPEGYDINNLSLIETADFKMKYQKAFQNSVVQENEQVEEVKLREVVKTKKIDSAKFKKTLAAILVFAALVTSSAVLHHEFNETEDVKEYQKHLDTAIGNHSLIVGLVNQNKEIISVDEQGNPTTVVNFEGVKEDITKVYNEVPEQLDMALYTVIADLGDENIPNAKELSNDEIAMNRIKNSDTIFEDLYEDGIVEDLDTLSHMIRVVRENNGMPEEDLIEIEKQVNTMGAYIGIDYVKDLYRAYDKVSKDNIESFQERGHRL